MLTLEGIADTCERVPQPVEEIEFLTPAQIREVLTAARAQDLARRRKTAPLVLGLLLSGCRLRELANLPWREVEDDGIRIEVARVKTRRGRVVGFAESPMLRRLIEAQRTPESKPDDLVWPGVVWSWDLAVRRMVQEFGAPPFTAHTLRRTCGTLLTCAPGIFGGASAFMSAKRLGHSVEIAERLYAGTLRDLPADAKTLEAAAGITDLAESICSDAEGGGE